jgi:pimeloyl-ACP methyl ester carboxylesterase
MKTPDKMKIRVMRPSIRWDGNVSSISGGDVVVVIPGILGSTLSRNSRQTWGYKQVASSIFRLAAQLTDDLALPGEAFTQISDGFDDGTEVLGVLKTVGIIPGLWSIDGYDHMLSRLRGWFDQDAECIHEFAYDWRQSNEFTARALQRFVEPLVQRRRVTAPDTRLVLVGHSMGGLIARYYAECLDSRKLTRKVITIGTPYLGSIKALLVLANGFARIGPVKLQLGELARSLPSVAELLPAYDCLQRADGQTPVGELLSDIPGLPEVARERCLTFHRRLYDAEANNGDERPGYHAILSHRQKTDVWATVRDGETYGVPSIDSDNAGDGTVPRCSATPPEWPDDSRGIYVAGKHSSLQRQPETLTQLRGIFTSRPRRPQAAIDELLVEAAPIASVGEAWTVEVITVEGSESLPLALTITDPYQPEREPIADVTMTPDGAGHYHVSVPIDSTGVFRWTVRTPPTAAVPVDPISDIVLSVDSS